MRDATPNQHEEQFNVVQPDLSSYYKFFVQFQKSIICSWTPHLRFTGAKILSVVFFFSGLCSSDDEISEKPPLALKPSELHNTPSQGGNAHTHTWEPRPWRFLSEPSVSDPQWTTAATGRRWRPRAERTLPRGLSAWRPRSVRWWGVCAKWMRKMTSWFR